MDNMLTEQPGAQVRLYGVTDRAVRLLGSGLFSRLDYLSLTEWYHKKSDPFAAGEFWGKIMRAAVLCWRYTGDEALRAKLDASVQDLLSCREPNGCISTVPAEQQPVGANGSDLWERKYVLLGLLGYYNTFGGDDILDAIRRQADVICEQVGEPPKTPIGDAGFAFYGIESSSLLDPIMQLYTLTREPRYLSFARYIVEVAGGCKRENIFEAVENGRDPMQVGSNGNPKASIAKAYEMMSCFEGLCQYAQETDSARWRQVCVTFYEKVRDQEITLLGSGGASHPFNLGPGDGEQWNHTASEQTNPGIGKTMETCVTITWMKLCAHVLEMTGDPRAFDQIERAYNNALLGAMRPDGLYFDYFQQFNGKRNGPNNYTFDVKGFPLSCCTANGPAGLCRIPRLAFLRGGDGLYANLFEPGRYQDGDFTVRVETAYPRRGDVRLIVEKAPVHPVAIALRVPGWAENPRGFVNEQRLDAIPGAYLSETRAWQPGDTLRLQFDPTVRAIPAPHGSDRAGDAFTAYVYGGYLLARDKRFDQAFNQPTAPAEGSVPFAYLRIPDAELSVKVGDMTLIDYASAGHTWDEASAFRSWIPQT